MKKSGYGLISVLIIIIIILCSVIFLMMSGDNPSATPATDENSIKHTTNLYFTKDGFSLITEEREIVVNSQDDIYKATLEELIKGPASDEFTSTVHKKTKINYVTVLDNTATVDFTETFVKYNTGGSTREYLCIHAITGSLFEFKEIQKVIFTVNGKPITTFGQFDMTDPFYNN